MPKAIPQPLTPAEFHTWRKEHGYTQSRVAETLGVDIRTVQRWETGQYPHPKWLHLALASLSKRKPKSK